MVDDPSVCQHSDVEQIGLQLLLKRRVTIVKTMTL